MRRISSQFGVTLMELVVTLAILGILATIGTPVLLENISAAKNVDAQNTLNSIYLMQKNYFEKNNCYYGSGSSTDDREKINQILFESSSPTSGPIVANDFKFSVSVSGCDKYLATATRANVIEYTIDQQNVKNKKDLTKP